MPAGAGVSLSLVLLLGAVFAASLTLTRVLVPLLGRAVLDRPNERSSHKVPTPRGGGIAVLGTVLPAWVAAIWLGWAPGETVAAIVGAVVLATVSFADDARGLPAGARLVAQLGTVALVLPWLPHAGHVFQGWLPASLDLAVAGLLWVWLINLNNFMDGIDGISGIGTICVAAGLAAIGVAAGHLAGWTVPAALLAAGTAGFLVWNWHPARIFMGDVGSVPIGFLLGWLLFDAAGAGLWAPALILPLYSVTDATVTLARRVARGEKPWEPHREHFYQQAVRRGLSHAAVVCRILVADAGLILCALASLRRPGWALAAALAVVVALLAVLRGSGPSGRQR
jgi:UDP-N-acetylmuramyl pentapeptide phosphotransferase/UDP-N-acetylglucosamine-1-phosphate transferase